MTTIKKPVLEAWKEMVKNNKEIRKLIKRNRTLEKKTLSTHFRARRAQRTKKKGKEQ